MSDKDFKKFLEDFNVFDLQDLNHIRHRADILHRIRFDVTPTDIMAPRTGPEMSKGIQGYIFYIEAYEEPLQLMLMRVGKQGVMSTIGKITEIPAEMLREAVDRPVSPPANNMYAITGAIEEWLRAEIGM